MASLPSIKALLLLAIMQSASAMATSSCRDNPSYKTKLGLACAEHVPWKCDGFAGAGFSIEEVDELLSNCPVSCGQCHPTGSEEDNIARSRVSDEMPVKRQSAKKINHINSINKRGVSTFQTERKAAEACRPGWLDTCQDNPEYISKIDLPCWAHAVIDCTSLTDIGITEDQVLDLVTNCPCSCKVECGTYTLSPTKAPTNLPTQTMFPTAPVPTRSPTASPTLAPSGGPTVSPTFLPTSYPSFSPTSTPTKLPSATPTFIPTSTPSASPTSTVSQNPTGSPTTPMPTWPLGKPLYDPSAQNVESNNTNTTVQGDDSRSQTPISLIKPQRPQSDSFTFSTFIIVGIALGGATFLVWASVLFYKIGSAPRTRMNEVLPRTSRKKKREAAKKIHEELNSQKPGTSPSREEDTVGTGTKASEDSECDEEWDDNGDRACNGVQSSSTTGSTVRQPSSSQSTKIEEGNCECDGNYLQNMLNFRLGGMNKESERPERARQVLAEDISMKASDIGNIEVALTTGKSDFVTKESYMSRSHSDAPSHAWYSQEYGSSESGGSSTRFEDDTSFDHNEAVKEAMMAAKTASALSSRAPSRATSGKHSYTNKHEKLVYSGNESRSSPYLEAVRPDSIMLAVAAEQAQSQPEKQSFFSRLFGKKAQNEERASTDMVHSPCETPRVANRRHDDIESGQKCLPQRTQSGFTFGHIMSKEDADTDPVQINTDVVESRMFEPNPVPRLKPLHGAEASANTDVSQSIASRQRSATKNAKPVLLVNQQRSVDGASKQASNQGSRKVGTRIRSLSRGCKPNLQDNSSFDEIDEASLQVSMERAPMKITIVNQDGEEPSDSPSHVSSSQSTAEESSKGLQHIQSKKSSPVSPMPRAATSNVSRRIDFDKSSPASRGKSSKVSQRNGSNTSSPKGDNMSSKSSRSVEPSQITRSKQSTAHNSHSSNSRSLSTMSLSTRDDEDPNNAGVENHIEEDSASSAQSDIPCSSFSVGPMERTVSAVTTPSVIKANPSVLDHLDSTPSSPQRRGRRHAEDEQSRDDRDRRRTRSVSRHRTHSREERRHYHSDHKDRDHGERRFDGRPPRSDSRDRSHSRRREHSREDRRRHRSSSRGRDPSRDRRREDILRHHYRRDHDRDGHHDDRRRHNYDDRRRRDRRRSPKHHISKRHEESYDSSDASASVLFRPKLPFLPTVDSTGSTGSSGEADNSQYNR